MAYIYAYAPSDTDYSTIGCVGALLDEGAVFELKAGELGELTFEHPLDEYGKWRALTIGCVLRTMVPMRLCPGVRGDGTFVTSVDVYTVAATATRGERYIYSEPADGRRKALLEAGARVTVTAVADPSDDDSRYKVVCGRVSGWMERGGLQLERQAVPVRPDPAGLEAVEPSYAVRQQLFRVVDIRPCTDSGGRVRVRALRIAYDLLGNVTAYRASGAVSCREVCAGILNETVMPHPFKIYTDIGDSHVGFDARDKNPIQALIDPEEGVTARYGGEIVADDYDIYVLRRAGLDRGVRIECGRNLIGLEVTLDATRMANAALPRGEDADGTALYLDGRVVNGRHGYNYDARRGTCGDWLPEGFSFYVTPEGAVQGATVVSAGRAADALPRIAVFDAEDCKVERGSDGVTAAVARRRMAAQAVEKLSSGCDAPELSMDVDFILLGDTEEYRELRGLEALFVYDTVHVRHARLGVAADISLTSIEWQVRQGRVSGAAFGALKDVSPTIASWQLPKGIDGRKLGYGTVSAAALALDAVSGAKLADGSVTRSKLAAGAVALEQMDRAELEAYIRQIAREEIDADEGEA